MWTFATILGRGFVYEPGMLKSLLASFGNVVPPTYRGEDRLYDSLDSFDDSEDSDGDECECQECEDCDGSYGYTYKHENFMLIELFIHHAPIEALALSDVLCRPEQASYMLRVIERMLARGVDPNGLLDGEPVIFAAFQMRRPLPTLRAFADAGVDVNVRDAAGLTVLERAARLDDGGRAVEVLSGAEAAPIATRAALHAALTGSPRLLAQTLATADETVRSEFLDGPVLHSVLTKTRNASWVIDRVKILLEWGANAFACGDDGRTVFESFPDRRDHSRMWFNVLIFQILTAQSPDESFYTNDKYTPQFASFARMLFDDTHELSDHQRDLLAVLEPYRVHAAPTIKRARC